MQDIYSSIFTVWPLTTFTQVKERHTSLTSDCLKWLFLPVRCHLANCQIKPVELSLEASRSCREIDDKLEEVSRLGASSTAQLDALLFLIHNFP